MKTNTNTTNTKLADIKHDWWLADAEGEVLGRLASKVAQLLIGKHKTNFVGNLDCGDYVVVTNVDKIEVTGKKATQKNYYRHSGFPGGFKQITFEKQMEKDPKKVFEHAIKGMLPQNKLRAQYLKRLKLVIGAEHKFTDKKLQEIK